MAFWNRRPRETPQFDAATGQVVKSSPPDGAKAFSVSEPLRDYSQTYGWPYGDSYGALYRRQPAVRTCVDFLARNVAQLNLKTYMRLDNADREELDNHPLARLLRGPNPDTTRYRFMRDTVADIAIYDVAYWQKSRQGMSVRGVVRLPRPSITREVVDGVVTYRGKNSKIIPRTDLVIFPGYNPDGNPWGVSPLETLRRVLLEEFASQLNRENYWRNAARQPVAIERPIEAPEWSPEARQRFRTDWENTMSGSRNSGRTAILEEGMHLNDVGAFSPKDSEYIEGRRLTNEEVARAYGIAPNLLGMGQDTANANIESFHRQLYQDTLGPLLREIQDEIELQLLPELDDSPKSLRGRVYIEFNLAEKLKGSFEEQGRTLVTAVGVPYMTVNEGRARLNLPRIDDDSLDTPVQPLNVMYGGQPAVTVPTDVPQPGQRARKAEAPASVLRRRQQAAAAHTEMFRRYFQDQRAAVEVTKSRKATFDTERWDRKLQQELFTAAVPLARQSGRLAARQIGGVYDEEVTKNFLEESSLRSAQNINRQTAVLIDDADPDLIFGEVRAERLGLSTATGIINFARKDAAIQSERNDGRQRTKTWVVTSGKSRHPEMDGETVPVSENFSNGLAWPGDATGSPDEIAGCRCLLDLSG